MNHSPMTRLKIHVTNTKMVRDRSIMVKRLPYAYYYPLNLWPKPRYPAEAIEESYETFQYRKMIEHMIKVG
ncbi:hypothetical protein O3G_MSEX006908 [Manduca sexta]|uniref:Uncharacterized protein n=1 Tax=Manduca sexta TaxID=7130 RepID=A0A921Z4B3_MANSE|nr:hypothetical protein O3G_MSEX006908 [Manduca sexta]